MWVWIIIGIVVAAAIVFALWPRAKGVSDRSVISARRTSQGGNESVVNSNRTQFPPL
ncbi:MAG: hypothetical protein WBP61_06285 [Nocardioides sp.]